MDIDIVMATLKEQLRGKTEEYDRRLDDVEDKIELHDQCLLNMKLNIAKNTWQMGLISFVGASCGGAIIAVIISKILI